MTPTYRLSERVGQRVGYAIAAHLPDRPMQWLFRQDWVERRVSDPKVLADLRRWKRQEQE